MVVVGEEEGEASFIHRLGILLRVTFITSPCSYIDTCVNSA